LLVARLRWTLTVESDRYVSRAISGFDSPVRLRRGWPAVLGRLTVDGIVVFDVPADVTLTSLELHDSAFSGGVTVGLG
jgi:hypothetical protein